jgi:hypothetical protein
MPALPRRQNRRTLTTDVCGFAHHGNRDRQLIQVAPAVVTASASPTCEPILWDGATEPFLLS